MPRSIRAVLAITALILAACAADPSGSQIDPPRLAATATSTPDAPAPTSEPASPVPDTVTVTVDATQAPLPLDPVMPQVSDITPIGATSTPRSPEQIHLSMVQRLAEFVRALCLKQETQTPLAKDLDRLLWQTISPDGQVALFSVLTPEQDKEVWAINADGTNLHSVPAFQEILGGSGNRVYLLRWLPNSREALITTARDYAESNYNNLYLVDIDTSEYRTLRPVDPDTTAQTAGGDFTVSPDGRHIAMVTATSVNLIDTDGSNWRQGVLLYDLVITYSEYFVFAQTTWSPDSSGVWITVPPTFEEENRAEFYYASVSGDVRQIGSLMLDGYPSHMALSPTGKYLTYSSHDGLRIVRVDGSDSQIVFDSVWYVEWIDATHIAFGDHLGDYIAEVGGDYTQLPYPSCLSYVRPVPR